MKSIAEHFAEYSEAAKPHQLTEYEETAFYAGILFLLTSYDPNKPINFVDCIALIQEAQTWLEAHVKAGK